MPLKSWEARTFFFGPTKLTLPEIDALHTPLSVTIQKLSKESSTIDKICLPGKVPLS